MLGRVQRQTHSVCLQHASSSIAKVPRGANSCHAQNNWNEDRQLGGNESVDVERCQRRLQRHERERLENFQSTGGAAALDVSVQVLRSHSERPRLEKKSLCACACEQEQWGLLWGVNAAAFNKGP